MPKYIKIEGMFEQDGRFAQKNTYKGYFEVEDEIYTVKTANAGELRTQYMVGGQKDGYDKEQLIRPSLGGIQRLRDGGMGSVFFRKLVNKEMTFPLSYGFEVGVDGWRGSLNGEWVPIDIQGEATASGSKAVATFSEVTRHDAAEYEEAKKTVEEAKEVLSGDLPYIMEVTRDAYEQNKETIKRVAEAGIFDKKTREYRMERKAEQKQKKASKLNSRFGGQTKADEKEDYTPF
jgi:hypothetical protein